MTQFLGLGHEAVIQPVSAGLALWYEARKPGGVVLDGSSNVSQYTDFSGNGRHATQVDPAQRPAFIASGFNSLPSVRGDGVNDDMACPVINAAAWTAFSVVLAAKDTTTLLSVMFEKNILNPGFGLYPNGGAVGRFQFQWKGGTSAARSIVPSVDITFASPTLISIVFDGSQAAANEIAIFRVNRAATAFTFDLGAGVETTGGFGSSAIQFFGRTATFPWPGDLPAYLLYDRALSLVEVQQNEQYINLGYGPF